MQTRARWKQGGFGCPLGVAGQGTLLSSREAMLYAICILFLPFVFFSPFLFSIFCFLEFELKSVGYQVSGHGGGRQGGWRRRLVGRGECPAHPARPAPPCSPCSPCSPWLARPTEQGEPPWLTQAAGGGRSTAGANPARVHAYGGNREGPDDADLGLGAEVGNVRRPNCGLELDVEKGEEWEGGHRVVMVGVKTVVGG